MSQTVVPTSTSVLESSLIPAHISQVWHLIKLPDFASWLSTIQSSAEVKGASPETETVRWISSRKNTAIATIRCFEVTSGPHAGSTFVQWSGNFSGDADAAVIEDGKYKRREALADLAKAATGKGTGKNV